MKLDFNSNAHEDESEPSVRGGYLILNAEGFENTATSGKTALMVAVLAKNDRMVGHMLSNGFDPNAQDEIGNTALMYATLVGCLKLCDLLVRGGTNLWITNRENETALQIAEKVGHHEIAEFMRNFEKVVAAPESVSLLEETLADGYVIAVKTKTYGVLPVIAVGAENTEIIVVNSNGQELMVRVLDCEEELTIRSEEFETRFTPAQIKRLCAA